MGLNGSIPPDIGNLSFLVSLDLSWNRLHGGLPKDICIHNKLPRVKELQLSFNDLEGEIPLGLGECQQLEILDLLYNNFGGHVPREIGNITRLTKLDLHWNNLSGTIPKEIGHLSNLEFMDLGSNKLRIHPKRSREQSYTKTQGNLIQSQRENCVLFVFTF
ncbi:putative leucine-rich repeat receptor-like serine/threonine-protein kinase At2g24130 [Salvia hispanica]|uniref:putative leucine-rich repeat receptor-like serine/threonine-protein kinase At2g24130 n=1 Tax=Salvia hispanica TaxID=49212 RepID=UPI0020094E3C|nr:putative leucine-rich repeat receptor-like serine/threonine-protein kinase At2g24130 [Salvia hispanica]